MFGGVSGSSTFSALPLYARLAKSSREDEIAKFAKRPAVKIEVDNFRANIGKIQSPDAFIKNYRVLKFALTSYGMESQAQYPARVKQVLMSDPNDRYSVANRMTDERYRTMATDFSFATKGVEQLSSPDFADYLVQGYISNEYEKSLGDLNPVLTDAMYFRRKISSVTKIENFYGDNVMFEVVKEALAIPNAAVTASVPQLTARIARGFDVSRVKDAAYVDKFVQRYIAMKELAANKGTSSPLLGILA